MSRDVKILLIENHPLVRTGCLRIFEQRQDLITATASSAAAGLASNLTFKPDIAILDIALPDRNGLDLIQPLLRDNCVLKIIVLSMYTDSSIVDRALEYGARGYLSKDDDSAAILMAIDTIMQGGTYLGQAVAQNSVLDRLSQKHSPLQALTKRERAILMQLGKGRSLTEVSANIGLSYKTIANAVTRIKHKLKTPTNAALIKFAVEHAGGIAELMPSGGR